MNRVLVLGVIGALAAAIMTSTAFESAFALKQELGGAAEFSPGVRQQEGENSAVKIAPGIRQQEEDDSATEFAPGPEALEEGIIGPPLRK